MSMFDDFRLRFCTSLHFLDRFCEKMRDSSKVKVGFALVLLRNWISCFSTLDKKWSRNMKSGNPWKCMKIESYWIITVWKYIHFGYDTKLIFLVPGFILHWKTHWRPTCPPCPTQFCQENRLRTVSTSLKQRNTSKIMICRAKAASII